MIDLLLMPGETGERLLGVVGGERRPEEERVVVRASNHQLGGGRSKFSIAGEGEGLRCKFGVSQSDQPKGEEFGQRTFLIRSGLFTLLIIRSGAEDEVGIECHRVDPMCVIVQCADQLALFADPSRSAPSSGYLQPYSHPSHSTT